MNQHLPQGLVERRALFLPRRRMLARLFNFSSQKAALELLKPGRKATGFVVRQNHPAQPEDRTVIVGRVFAGYVRADMAEFVEVRDIKHVGPRNTKAHAFAWASERGQPNLSGRVSVSDIGRTDKCVKVGHLLPERLASFFEISIDFYEDIRILRG